MTDVTWQRTVAKALAIGVVGGLLALALGRIEGLVDERRARSLEAENSVVESQAGRQALLGPVLQSRCTEAWDEREGSGKEARTVEKRREFTLGAVPRTASVEAKVAMEPRYRGLFKVNTYVARLQLAAEWGPLTALRPVAEHAGSRLACGAPTVLVALSDARGIRRAVVQLDGQPLEVAPGTGHDRYLAGFRAALPEARRQAAAPLKLGIALDLVGTSALAIVPMADDARAHVVGDWPHPSFGGRFLPQARQVGSQAFDATWAVSSLATQATQDFLRGEAKLCPSGGEGARSGCIDTFDIDFIDPVNPYSLSDRAIKYGMLFIGLTFVAVGMVELLGRRRVHPVQYLLVGCAISLFFLLLLALSEHVAFGASYAAAAGACAGLLTFYGRHMLGGWGAGAFFGAGIAGLYGALYVLLQLEQASLLTGAVLLFCVLAGVMVATRRLDWHRLADTNLQQAEAS